MDHPLRPGPRDMRCWLAGWGRESTVLLAMLLAPRASMLPSPSSLSRALVIPLFPMAPVSFFFPLLPHAVEDGGRWANPGGQSPGEESLASWQGAQGRFFECKGAHETVEGLVSGRGVRNAQCWGAGRAGQKGWDVRRRCFLGDDGRIAESATQSVDFDTRSPPHVQSSTRAVHAEEEGIPQDEGCPGLYWPRIPRHNKLP